MEKKCMLVMIMMMMMALTTMPLSAKGESYEDCYRRCISKCEIFYVGVDKCIHDCVGTKCHKAPVLPRRTAKGMFQEVNA
ncbi:unnamed protein product [Microthlaspi erraticum]|uniref:Knottin scorpion toxin-like domain-containing protein n=1 Tax=Microthlaspi erraticum TaxID=1685480 RepID=A0A6D2J088_9BRAS|nr:unnamed protein product [Microthlaspi erraticum]